MARILYRPVVTFLLGALVTLLTMSVSLSLSILVPLSMRGYVRRENVIPYVMGANITTFIDTLIGQSSGIHSGAGQYDQHRPGFPVCHHFLLSWV